MILTIDTDWKNEVIINKIIKKDNEYIFKIDNNINHLTIVSNGVLNCFATYSKVLISVNPDEENFILLIVAN
jgi:hypothetical protein